MGWQTRMYFGEEEESAVHIKPPFPACSFHLPWEILICGNEKIGALAAKKGEAILQQRLLSFPKWKCVYELRKMISGSSVQEKIKTDIKGIGWEVSVWCCWRSGEIIINEYKVQPHFFPQGLLNEAIRDSSRSLQTQRFCPVIKKWQASFSPTTQTHAASFSARSRFLADIQ